MSAAAVAAGGTRTVGEERLSGETGEAASRTKLGADVRRAAERAMAWKYCGGGFGGYAVYLFADQADRDGACACPAFRPVEPYVES